MGAIFILLAVGALIGTWNMAGTIPTVVAYGIALLRPAIFYAAVALDLRASSGMVTGQLVDDRRHARRGLHRHGADPRHVDHDRGRSHHLRRLHGRQDVAALGDDGARAEPRRRRDHRRAHQGDDAGRSCPSFGLALVVFLVLGLTADPARRRSTRRGRGDALDAVFNISPINLLPIVLLIVLAFRKVPPFLAIFGIAAVHRRPRLHHPARRRARRSSTTRARAPCSNGIEAIYTSMANGFVLDRAATRRSTTCSPAAAWRACCTTVWLILGALSFAAIMEEAGLLHRLIAPLVAGRTSDAGLIAVRGGHRHRAERRRRRPVRRRRAARAASTAASSPERGLAPRMLSRTVEDTGTVTSPLVPWNSCGAYMTGCSASRRCSTLPWAFFNYLNPLVALGYALTGFRVEHARADEPDADRRASRRRRSAVDRLKEELDVQRRRPRRPDADTDRRSRPKEPSRGSSCRRPTRSCSGSSSSPRSRRGSSRPAYALDEDGSPIPGTYEEVDATPARILVDSLKAPINGLYGIEDPVTGNVDVYNTGDAVRRDRRRAVHPRDRRVHRRSR